MWLGNAILSHRQRIVKSDNVRSFGHQLTVHTGRGSALNTIDSEFPNLEASLSEVRRLREENAWLRSLLIERSIRIPEFPSTSGIPRTPPTTNAVPDVCRLALGTAEERIELFRSLFRGRDDVYAVRWENADGRSGYMPNADRDWKSYLRAKDKDRKKVDRQTRKFRPLTQDVVRGHLVGEHTVGIYPLLQDEACWFLAVDFDKRTWQKDVAAFLTAGREMNVPAVVEVPAQETAAMCGYSSIERFLRPPHENWAAQS